jgi:DNA-binding transcriptional ArsR family regulator
VGARSKAELYNLVEKIMAYYTKEHLTIKQIVERLKEYNIGRSAVSHAIRNEKEAALKMSEMFEKAKVMTEAIKDSSGTEVIEAAIDQMTGFYMEYAMSMERLDVDDPAKAVQGLTALANAKAKIAATRLNFQNGFEAAKKSVLSSLKQELQSYPDILEKLTAIVSALEAESGKRV